MRIQQKNNTPPYFTQAFQQHKAEVKLLYNHLKLQVAKGKCESQEPHHSKGFPKAMKDSQVSLNTIGNG